MLGFERFLFLLVTLSSFSHEFLLLCDRDLFRVFCELIRDGLEQGFGGLEVVRADVVAFALLGQVLQSERQ